MIEYQKFSISNFRTGLNESLQPWLLPRDAFQSVINAHLYLGVLENIQGYTLFANFTNRNIVAMTQSPDGARVTFTKTISPLPVTNNFYGYGTLVEGSTAEIFTYSSDGISPVINLMGSLGGTGTVNTSTGVVSLTFNTAPPTGTGYSNVFFEWDITPTGGPYAIMGIEQYYISNGSQTVLVFDEKRVGTIQSISGFMSLNAGTNQAIQEIPHDYYLSNAFTGSGGKTYIGTIAPLIQPGTVVFTEYSTSPAGTPTGIVLTDNGQGAILGTGVGSGFINYLTGAFKIVFTANLANTLYYDATAGIFGNIFTGGISNFFDVSNYKYFAFITNSVDPIFYYDGISLHYLNTNLSVESVSATSGVPSFDIAKCLHLQAYRERLVLLNCTVDGIQQVSTAYWSTAGQPLDFTNNEFLPASTSEPIRLFGLINTDMIVRFANSERVFRYTGDAFSPFRWDATNNLFACDAPYSNINYDTWFSSVGRPAIVGSDGVNVKRADDLIPDFTDPQRLALQTPLPYINQESIGQCYGQRFDDLKEGWLCYNSAPDAEAEVTASDNVLAYNYLDGTYAIYKFPFSCLGLGKVITTQTWGNTYQTWAGTSETWDSYQLSNNSLIDLGGDQFDKVYELNSGNSLGDDVTPVPMSVITKNFNPFVEEGQLCRFGYLDLFVSANAQTILRVQFYVNDELYIDSSGNPAGFYQETVLEFIPTDAMSPTEMQTKIWKRIYIGAVGKSHTIRFYQNDFTTSTLYQPVYIHAMILHMKPAGRIFN